MVTYEQKTRDQLILELKELRRKLSEVELQNTALSLENTERRRIQDDLRQNESVHRFLAETAGQLLASDNPLGIVNELCRKVMAHLDCHFFFYFLVDGQTGGLRLNAYAGITEDEARRIEWLDYGSAVYGCGARDEAPRIAANILDILDALMNLAKSYGIRAYSCYPIIADGRLAGTLSFGTRTRHQFSTQDITIMKTVTDQVAAAMQQEILKERLRKSRDELEQRLDSFFRSAT